MTTPEQIQTWREEAKAAYLADPNPDGWHSAVQCYINGYLRCCQETEQAIKDARKKALEEAIEIIENANIPDCGGWTPIEMVEKIKELLK